MSIPHCNKITLLFTWHLLKTVLNKQLRKLKFFYTLEHGATAVSWLLHNQHCLTQFFENVESKTSSIRENVPGWRPGWRISAIIIEILDEINNYNQCSVISQRWQLMNIERNQWKKLLQSKNRNDQIFTMQAFAESQKWYNDDRIWHYMKLFETLATSLATIKMFKQHCKPVTITENL